MDLLFFSRRCFHRGESYSLSYRLFLVELGSVVVRKLVLTSLRWEASAEWTFERSRSLGSVFGGSSRGCLVWPGDPDREKGGGEKSERMCWFSWHQCCVSSESRL